MAVRKFLRGEYDSHNGKFLPTTAELSKAVKYEDAFIRAKERRMLKPPVAVDPENVLQIDFTPEHREKMKLKFKQLSASLGSNNSTLTGE